MTRRCKACDLARVQARERAARAQDPEGYRHHHNRLAAAERMRNRDKLLVRMRRDWQLHGAKRRAAKRAYRLSHKEEIATQHTRWRQGHPEKWAAAGRRRRAVKRQAPVNDLTAEQWEEIKTAFAHRCVYCPSTCRYCRQHRHALTQDHIVPLSKGGSHTASNVVPACRSCNAKKHVGPPPVPVQPLLLTVAPSKKPRR